MGVAVGPSILFTKTQDGYLICQPSSTFGRSIYIKKVSYKRTYTWPRK